MSEAIFSFRLNARARSSAPRAQLRAERRAFSRAGWQAHEMPARGWSHAFGGRAARTLRLAARRYAHWHVTGSGGAVNVWLGRHRVTAAGDAASENAHREHNPEEVSDWLATFPAAEAELIRRRMQHPARPVLCRSRLCRYTRQAPSMFDCWRDCAWRCQVCGADTYAGGDVPDALARLAAEPSRAECPAGHGRMVLARF